MGATRDGPKVEWATCTHLDREGHRAPRAFPDVRSALRLGISEQRSGAGLQTRDAEMDLASMLGGLARGHAVNSEHNAI